MKKKYLLTIRTQDAPGVLSKILQIMSRRRLEVSGLTMSPSDIHDIVLTFIEADMFSNELKPVLLQIEKIIEVFTATGSAVDDLITQRLAFFKLDKNILQTEQGKNIYHYQAQIIDWQQETITISKVGNEVILREFYNKLDGPHLIGFIQSGLMASCAMDIPSNDDYRITGLAA